MADIDARTLGSRIRQARERAGLTQGALGDLAGLDRTAVNKIEVGARKVTAIELSDIAAAIGVRMSSFFDAPLPALVSHRSNQGLDTADSKIDQLLAEIAADVELVAALAASELGLDAATSRLSGYPLPSPESMSEAERLAERVRGDVDLDRHEPVADVVERACIVGLLVFSHDLGVDIADAGTIMLRTGGVSVVNSHNKVGRRRLAAAHELGHFVTADLYTVDWRIAHDGDDIEARLDRFARAFLLPAAGLTATWQQLGERGVDLREKAVRLGSRFRVDMATLARRLRELELVDSDQAAVIRAVTTTRADIVELGLLVPSDLAGTSLPVPYQRAVLRAVRDERVSRERALELLRGTFSYEDLPPIRLRNESEILAIAT